ncbi:transketolase [Enterobacteriaceae bacterium BIT-l23]|uniref:transketolase n=1 Tax=Jejubacter sp. L23 TaxID=3092086 RepID=UPI001584E3F7|nr:transketolase [Enterobacteriaceae bacterium BIT-l23]
MTMPNELANAIRILSIDAIEKAKSGHPGAPMGMADIAEVLWRKFLRHNPDNPKWDNRDRFVFSNGHGSMLIYSLLHLSGYALSIDDIKNFRQLHSKTPGHPEYGYAPGVETTTGPLGQGIANAVGMALAEKTLAAQFNRPEHAIVDHYTYAFLGDGCLMEGISHEVCSLAGTLGLGKLIAIYDDNGITVDGSTDGVFTDNTPLRFESYHWHVIRDVDGHDPQAISAAIEAARAEKQKPSLIICKTVIGYGSPNRAGSETIHGAPLGAAETQLTRERLNWPYGAFEIPEHIYQQWNAREQGREWEAQWQSLFQSYREKWPEQAAEYQRRIHQALPENWHDYADALIQQLQETPVDVATRKASQTALEAFAQILPEYLGGCADITPSCLTTWSGSVPVHQQADGNFIHYGVREFGMTAMANGIALHGGFLPYTSTFLMFVEYARNAVRMAALMKLRHIMVYTHDSIGMGEDGPTHQPVEQLASLRITPGLRTWRPCDRVEAAVAWRAAIERTDGPTAFSLSRQTLPQQQRDPEQLNNIARGGYVIRSCEGTPQLIVIATGSEVELAIQAWQQLSNEGISARVVSMPSPETFDSQEPHYKESVLPKSVRARLAVEAASAQYWERYVGLDGAVIGMTTFGESAPADVLFQRFGFTVRNIVQTAKSLLS